MKILKALFLLFPVLTMNCFDSALSDVRLTDPSVICLKADMSQIKSINGSTSQSIQVILEDKNHNDIELKDGKVLVNNVEMDLEHSLLGGGPYYVMTSNQVKTTIDSLFTFTIVLADSHKYNSTIRTQKKDLNFLILPESHNKTDSLKIKFGLFDSESFKTIAITKTLKGDSLNDIFYSHSYDSRTLTFVDTGYIVLAPSYFEPNLDHIDIKITSEKSGTPNASLRNGSYVTCTLELYGAVTTVPWISIRKR